MPVWGPMAVAALAVHEPIDSPTRDAPYRCFTWLSPAHRVFVVPLVARPEPAP